MLEANFYETGIGFQKFMICSYTWIKCSNLKACFIRFQTSMEMRFISNQFIKDGLQVQQAYQNELGLSYFTELGLM